MASVEGTGRIKFRCMDVLVASGISGLLLLGSWLTGRWVVWLVGWLEGFALSVGWGCWLLRRSVGFVGQSVCQLIDWLVGWLVGWSVG